jgi:hypothetical protein
VGNGSGVISRNYGKCEEEPWQDLVSAASFQAKCTLSNQALSKRA